MSPFTASSRAACKTRRISAMCALRSARGGPGGFQFFETEIALVDLIVALTIHLEKIRIRDLTGDVVLEQLALFLFSELAPGTLRVDLLRKTGIVLTDRAVHFDIALDQFIGIDVRFLEYVHQNRPQLLFVTAAGKDRSPFRS